MNNRLIVSRSALTANYHRLRENARGEVAAVVKADGYGLGAAEVSRCLAAAGCREFFVATAAEGKALRAHLPEAQIYVLEGVWAETAAILAAAELIPVLNTPTQAQVWSASARPAALHVDTGMQRLGLPVADAASIIATLDCPLTLLITHFARADEPDHPANAQQLALITPLFDALRAQHPQARLSVSNSAALLCGLGPEDLGRAGIGLYGGNPFSGRANPMQPAARLEARVLQVRDIGADVPVGYGGSFISAAPMRLATVAAGYADGVPRLLSDNGRVYLNGAYADIVGRVSMDMLHVDVTSVTAAEGDWAEVIGAHVTVDEVAEHARTLSYEVLTGLGSRVPRIYVDAEI